jgi:hypothetical protein
LRKWSNELFIDRLLA